MASIDRTLKFETWFCSNIDITNEIYDLFLTIWKNKSKCCSENKEISFVDVLHDNGLNEADQTDIKRFFEVFDTKILASFESKASIDDFDGRNRMLYHFRWNGKTAPFEFSNTTGDMKFYFWEYNLHLDDKKKKINLNIKFKRLDRGEDFLKHIRLNIHLTIDNRRKVNNFRELNERITKQFCLFCSKFNATGVDVRLVKKCVFYFDWNDNVVIQYTQNR